MTQNVLKRRNLRHRRVRRIVVGTAEIPRLSVFRSAKNMYLQLIDDKEGKTLVAISTQEVQDVSTKTQAAKAAGLLLAQRALALKIKSVIFDRGGYKYHGRVAAVASGAREGGLVF